MPRPLLSSALEDIIEHENWPVFRHRKEIVREVGFRGWLKVLFDPPRKLYPTKVGWIFFAFMSGIVVFAITTNNNLLFMLFSSMLALMIVSGLLSEASLRDVGVKRRLPDEIFAGQTFLLDYEIINRSKWLSALAFGIQDSFLFNNLRPPFVVRLDKKETISLSARAMIPTRGEHRLPRFALTTEYPFLLFRKVRDMYLNDTVLVFPEPNFVGLSMDRLQASGGVQKETLPGEGDTLSFVRDYRPGEPSRRIDWRKSAKTTNLMAKEFEREQTRRVLVIFDPEEQSTFEAGLCSATGILLRLEEWGIDYALCLNADPVSFNRGRHHLHQALGRLARYQHPESPQLPEGEYVQLRVRADGSYAIGR